MWIYICKALMIATSFFILKLILAADSLSETRVYLMALAVAGALSLLEFGLGDYLLQRARNGATRGCVASDIHKLLYALFAVSGLSLIVLSFLWSLTTFAEVFILGGIFFYSSTNVLLGVHQKIAFINTDFKSSYFCYSGVILAVLVLAFACHSIFDTWVGSLALVLYGTATLSALVLNDFHRLPLSFEISEKSKVVPIRRVGLSVENILNSLTLMLIGLAIAALPSKMDITLFSVYARIVNVIAMFGMIYILTIWQSDHKQKLLVVASKYLFLSLFAVGMFIMYEAHWIYLLVSDVNSTISLSLLIATPLVLWRVFGDLVSQMAKRRSIEWIVICNSIVQCLLIFLGITADFLGRYSTELFLGLLASGCLISGTLLAYLLIPTFINAIKR